MSNNKYKVLDLFCGCGGISEGYYLAGFDIVGGIDFNEDATMTFAHNFKEAKVHNIDINSFTNEQLMLEYGDVDVIVGGPPCQGFSTANRHQKEKDDPRNKLFFEYIRFVQNIHPKIIMIENVRGLLTRDNGYVINRIEEILGSEGYNISYQVLDASEYGVPQNRKRAIIIGIRKNFMNITFDFDLIEKQEKTTVEDAIGELYAFEEAPAGIKTLSSEANSVLRLYLRANDNKVLDHDIVYPAEKVQERIKHVPQGGNWQDVPSHLWPSNRQNRHSSAYKRLNPATQSCTIDTGNAHSNYFHPIYNRIPTIRESARLQSFPDSFEFIGTRGSKYRQVGNAVPPLLSKAIASAIKKILENEDN
ncbi:MAG: DNA cytosine methyltransferase [Muribaculum sp.]|nr:DNA cytosine methyltransferase [Muribaculum sp.]